MNSNNYDFLFKYIVVGDASKSRLMKVLGNRALFWGILSNFSKMIMSLLLEYSLHQKFSLLTTWTSRLKSGIQYSSCYARPDRNLLKQSLGLITRAPLGFFLFSTSQTKTPSKVCTNGSTRSKIILMTKLRSFCWEISWI